jgi:hypothetical protein
MQSELSGLTRPYTTSPVGENRRDHWDGPRAAPRRDYPIDQTAARHPDLVKLGWHALHRPAVGGRLVHGYSDYFFNTELAERYNSRGFDFYAIDLRTYGRSLRPHPLLRPVDGRVLRGAGRRHRSHPEPRRAHGSALQRALHWGLTGSLYADARRDAGTIDAVFLNSPYFDLNASWLCPGAHVDEVDIPPRRSR